MQLRCTALPLSRARRPLRTPRKERWSLKLTRHNGRAGKHGTYNPKHNDRSFEIANSEHIDLERVQQNIYWDCYNGIRSALQPKDVDSLADTFEEVEKLYYKLHYTNFTERQNERQRQNPAHRTKPLHRRFAYQQENLSRRKHLSAWNIGKPRFPERAFSNRHRIYGRVP